MRPVRATTATVLTLSLALALALAAAEPASAVSAARFADAATLRSKGISTSHWSAPAAPGELLVVFTSSRGRTARAGFSAGVRRSGGSMQSWHAGDTAAIVGVPGNLTRKAYAEQLAEQPSVAWVQPVYSYRALALPDDPLYSRQWGLPRIGAPTGWGTQAGSASVAIGVVDTGVDLSHPDLAGKVDSANGWDFANNDAVAQDDEGHGTHVAGIAAAATNNGLFVAGTAPNVRILPVKSLDSTGYGETTWVADGIAWAVDHGAGVVNLSLGGPADDPYLASAVRYARSNNVVVCAAAGNDGASTGAIYPARYPGVLGVAAIDFRSRHAGFSNTGEGIDIAAPGVSIVSTLWDAGNSTSGTLSGTSMATPFVSGVAALVRSQFPSMDATQVADRLQSTAEDLGSPGFDTQFGSGLVRADRAVGAPTPAPDGNGDVPGEAIPVSPVTDRSLDYLFNHDDVYAVHMNAGQTFTTYLDGTPSNPYTDFDLFLFSPTAGSITAATPIASSTRSTYPDSISYTAPVTGDYYLDVRADAGSGFYQLDWSVADDPNATIPGSPIPASPFSDSLTRLVDERDVFAVDAQAMQVLSFTLNGAPGTTFALDIYGPSATPATMSSPLASANTGGAYPEMLGYRVPSAGTYYVAVRRVSGSGPYSLAWSATWPSATVTRASGATRYDVAAELARRGWDPTGSSHWTGVSRVIIASGDDQAAADTLSAAGLAGAYAAPVLLVKSDPAAKLPAATAQVLAEIAAANPGVQVHIVGGPASVPDKTWKRISAIRGVSAAKDRLGGRDRYEVSAAVANRMLDVVGPGQMPGVLEYCAENPAAFFDALAAGPGAYHASLPMLALRTKSVSPSVSALLRGRLAGKPRFAVSSSAYLSDAVLKATGASGRLATSADRYVAASQIAQAQIAAGWVTSTDTGLAAKLPDALTGGVFLGRMGGSLIFTDSSRTLRPAASGFVSARRFYIDRGWVLGGPVSVTPQAEAQFRALLP